MNSVLDMMDQSDFLASIDSFVFTMTRASGTEILAVPVMVNLIELIVSLGNATSPSSLILSQLPEFDGPLVITAAG